MKHKGYHRRRNPEYMNLGVKVAGALGGAVLAGTVPAMINATYDAGWTGVLLAAAVTYAVAWGARKVSPNLGEGALLGGGVQVGARIIKIITGKSVLSVSALRGYGPFSSPVPFPGYNTNPPAQIPAGSGVTAPGGGMGVVRSRSRHAA
jgi:hypothetical protein